MSMAHNTDADPTAKLEVEGEIGAPPTPKEWRRPALRKLPIAATSGPSTFNQGVGQGKGSSGENVTS